ncbi:hypothetical protein COXBURSA334_1577 [Coxiella burnetii Q321]|nr:hypothetical protein COXBURSA334_1577 [Coxiella burnetii Q321]
MRSLTAATLVFDFPVFLDMDFFREKVFFFIAIVFPYLK